MEVATKAADPSSRWLGSPPARERDEESSFRRTDDLPTPGADSEQERGEERHERDGHPREERGFARRDELERERLQGEAEEGEEADERPGGDLGGGRGRAGGRGER